MVWVGFDPDNCFANRSDPARSAGGSQDNITLILDVIKSSVRFHKSISEAWLKVGNFGGNCSCPSVLLTTFFFYIFFYQAIEAVTEVEGHKVSLRSFLCISGRGWGEGAV